MTFNLKEEIYFHTRKFLALLPRHLVQLSFHYLVPLLIKNVKVSLKDQDKCTVSNSSFEQEV